MATATSIMILVEQGKLRWDSTIAEVFPELAPTMHEGYRGVTLEQLLTHTGGLRGDDGPANFFDGMKSSSSSSGM